MAGFALVHVLENVYAAFRPVCARRTRMKGVLAVVCYVLSFCVQKGWSVRYNLLVGKCFLTGLVALLLCSLL